MLSGHSENMLDSADAAGLSTNPWRGSVEKVIGIPRPERSASSCAELTQWANSRESFASPIT